MAVGVGELSTLGVGKETTFGVLPTITLFHPLESLTPGDKNVLNPRPGSRGAPDMSFPATGPFQGSLSMRVEAQPDVFNQLLAYAMGTQSTPVLVNPGQGILINAQSTTGTNTTNPIALSTGGIVTPGTSGAVVGVGNPVDAEVVTAAVGSTPSSLVCNFTNAHAAGEAIQLIPNPANVGTIGTVSSTGSQAVSYTTTGAKPTVGQVFLIDYTSSTKVEYVVLTAVTGSTSPYTITAVFANTHGGTIKAANVGAPSTAYSQTLTFGKLLVLPSFTAEENRGTIDTIDFLGCSVDTLKLSLDSGKNLQVDLTCPYRSFAKNASPTTPTLGTKFPLSMEAPSTLVTLNGSPIGTSANPPAVLKWDVTLNNQLDKTRFSAGNLRYPVDFPLGQRKITGSITLGFENETAQQLFWGTPGSATTNQQVLQGVPLILAVGGQDYADAANFVNYLVQLIFPNIVLTGAPVAHKTSGALEQVCSFEAYSSIPGAGDAMSIVQINKNSTAY